ncbi:MAG: SDR family NAD(P)-dependent oxidoreductase [Pseudomonadales bacterium]
MLLDDQVVIVSGIGPGLGSKLAIEAALNGANIAISARTAAKLAEVEETIRKKEVPADILCVPTDITDRSQCEALVDKTLDRFGRIDALINCAYVIGNIEPVDHADLDDWRATMDVNFFGTMNLTQVVIPTMKARRRGAIVFVNTQVTRVPQLGQAGYGASKSALVSAAAHLANEMGQHGIRVNSMFPSYMWGEPVKAYLSELAREQGTSVDTLKSEIEKTLPLRRMPSDIECARAGVFLASDSASAITGACLDVNGGHYLPH